MLVPANQNPESIQLFFPQLTGLVVPQCQAGLQRV